MQPECDGGYAKSYDECVLQENLSEPLKSEDVDASSGILIPYYDFDTKVVFLAGKVFLLIS